MPEDHDYATLLADYRTALLTTRGDRLFISLLGSAFIFLGWLGLFGAPLWAPLGIAIVWFFFVFRWV